MTTHVTPPGERDQITRPEICPSCLFPIRRCQCFVEPEDGEYIEPEHEEHSEEIETEQ